MQKKLYKMDTETFLKLVKLSTALMLQNLYDKEVIDNISNELSDVVIEILRLTNEEEKVTL